MNETLNIVSTATTLPNKQFLQLLGAFDSHQTFSQKVNNITYHWVKGEIYFNLTISGNKRIRFNCVIDNELLEFAWQKAWRAFAFAFIFGAMSIGYYRTER